MDKEKMNWRSFVHQDAISDKWNPSTPSYYVLDPKGVIRHKWVGAPGEKVINKALETLIEEAEADGKKSP
jgi:peroxiredoxin